MGNYHRDTARSGCSGDGSATAASSDPSAATASHYIHERAEAVLIAHHLTAGGALEAPTVEAAAAAPASSAGRREGRGRRPVNPAEAPSGSGCRLVVWVERVAMVRMVDNAAAVREGADAHWVVAAEPMRRGGKENARRRGRADTAPAAAAGAVVVRCRGGLAKGGLGRRAVTHKGVNGRC